MVSILYCLGLAFLVHVGNAAAVAVSARASGWSFLGCYTDSVSARSLPYTASVPGGSSAMTIELCQSTCLAAGYVLAGVEYADECYCGNALQNGGAPAPGGNAGCNMACAGNSAETCGGGNRLDLYSYSTTSSTPSSGWTILGCYTDSVSARSLPYTASVPGGSSAMTIELCQSTCLAAGYVLAGVEYADECYCGNALQNGGAPAPGGNAGCNMACAGNSAETCGGGNRLDLYSHSSTSSTSSSVSTASPSSTASPGWTMLGCYTDSVSARSLPYTASVPGGSSAMTIELCQSTCLAAGYKLAGVEYADECYCGNALQNGGAPAPDGTAGCNMACAGKSSETCGGGNRLDLYSYGGSSSTSSSVSTSSTAATSTPTPTSGGSSALSWVTSSDGVYKLSSYAAPVKGSGSTSLSTTWTLQVDDTSSGHKQSVTGFGAAVTDATVDDFSALPASQQSALLADLFTTSTHDGVAFSLLRHTIGASDLSPSLYSYDDNNGSPDPSLANFNLGSQGNAMLSWIARFKAINPAIRLLGSVWSPPGWMKLNGVMDGQTNNNNLNTAYASSFAQYFVKYIQAFAAGGVSVDAITIQNEPLNSQSGYPTMYVAADQSTSLIENNVGPALRAAGLSTQIWAYDHNTDVPSYPQTVLNGAGNYVNTVAWHCYASNNNWNVLTQFHQTNPNVAQYMTECWTSPTNTWYSTADFVMGPMQNWASGAIAWTMGSDTNYGPHLPGGCTSCRGLVVVDTNAGTYSKTLDYYLMGQFSRFVPRGAINLATTGSYDYGGGTKLEATAFLNSDGSRTVVIENILGNSVYMEVTFNSGETWSGPVYQQSLTTWQLPPTTG